MPDLDDDDLTRLQSACRLWGAVKFFHPTLSSGTIEWDDALLSTIPLVCAAADGGAYADAITHLLSVLDDPATRVLPEDDPARFLPAFPPFPASSEPGDEPFLQRMGGVTVFVARDMADRWNTPEFGVALDHAWTELARSEAVVLDLRGLQPPVFLRLDHLCSLFVDAPLQLPGVRIRSHYGYGAAGATGPLGAQTVISASRFVNPSAGGASRARLAVLVAAGQAGHYSPLPHAAALQVAGRAVLVVDGENATFAPGQRLVPLAHGLVATVRSGEWMHADATEGLVADVVVGGSDATNEADDPAVRAAVEAVQPGAGRNTTPRRRAVFMEASPPDDSYPEPRLPDPSHRLLGLFRLWNVIHHFFPYLPLCDRPWDDLLGEFIPELDKATTEAEYHLTMSRAIAWIQDSHTNISSPVLDGVLGTHAPPVTAEWVEAQSVIVQVAHGVTDIEVGDIVRAVDGLPVADRRAMLRDVVAAGHERSLERKVHALLLQGGEGTTASIELERSDGSVQTVRALRSTKSPLPSPRPLFLPPYTTLDNGLGYIDIDRVTDPQLSDAYQCIRDTPALILDMRGYPRSNFGSVIDRLLGVGGEPVPIAQVEIPIVGPDYIHRTVQHGRTRDLGSGYSGPIATLINERAMSAAEHTCLSLGAALGASFVGTPTAGADGNVSTLTLPGGITTRFTAHDVRHGDGRQLQRLGIQPDVWAEPTIAGIRAGRDEVLDAAVEHLQAKV